MATLNQVTSTTVWIRTILYLMRRVGKEGNTRHLVEGLRPTVEALDRVLAAVEAADRALVSARADLDAADNDVDEQLSILDFNMLQSVGRNRKAAAYRKVFPDGLTGATRTNPEGQLRICRRIEEVLARDFAGDATAQQSLAAIRVAREDLERRLAAYRQALDDLHAARAAERQARIDAGDAYRIAYADLVKVFPQNLRKVRSYFREARANSAADEPPSPGSVEPAPVEPAPVVTDGPMPS